MNEIGGQRGVRGVSSEYVKEAIDRHLGPIATDPARESWQDFVLRARHHWIAREHEARSVGFKRAGKETEWKNLDRDIRWLLRHQVDRESPESIAGPSDVKDAVDPDKVKKAIDRLCRYIGIRRKRGRPRRTRITE
jgi:hypothetical protein